MMMIPYAPSCRNNVTNAYGILERNEQFFGAERPRTVDVSYPNTHERLHSSSNAYQGSGSASPNELRGVYPYSGQGSSVPDHWLALPMCLSICNHTRKSVHNQDSVCIQVKDCLRRPDG